MKNKIMLELIQINKIEFLKTRLLVSVLFCAILLLSSCKKSFVVVDLPISQLPATEVFQDKFTVNAAMVNIYAKMRDAGMLVGGISGMSHQLGNYADELVYYGNVTSSPTFFYKNTILPSNPTILTWWREGYNGIYASNAILEGVSASAALADADKNQLIGEALFVRSFLHFYLLNLFGDVPYITTTNYQQNKVASRMPTGELYSHIIDDLKQASFLLPDAYISSDRIRPNKSVATALLARVYLYKGMWTEAASAASNLINNTTYAWETNLDKIFLKAGSTTIWQLIPRNVGASTQEGNTFVLLSGPPGNSALSNQIINGFELGDLRRNRWVGSVTKAGTTWYFSNKYKQRSAASSSSEYSIVFRLAEQYLIRAEARAQQGDLTGAKADLNKIRNTAGLGETTALTQQDILTAILQERKVELFAEYGHRFFDLKRANKLDEALSSFKLGWKTNYRLLPLPEADLTLNPTLNPQNPGY